MLFVQTTAPVGFTKSAAHNNKALRVVSGTAGSGGSVAFTTAFASKAVSGTVANGTAGGTVANGTAGGTVANTTLSTSMSASHTHTYTLRFGTYTGGGYPGFDGSGDRLVDAAATTGASDGGGGGAHGHGFTGAAHNHGFTGAAHGHGFTGTAIDLAVQYVDVIICTKD